MKEVFFVLFVFFETPTGVSIAMHDFNNVVSCSAAGRVLEEEFEAEGLKVRTYCLSKY